MHQKTISKYAWTTEQLVEDIGNLDYDALGDVFALLSRKFEKDALKDLDLWHPIVSNYLKHIAKWLEKILNEDVQPLADLCRSYNEKGLK